jgi:hypothetical protein
MTSKRARRALSSSRSPGRIEHPIGVKAPGRWRITGSSGLAGELYRASGPDTIFAPVVSAPPARRRVRYPSPGAAVASVTRSREGGGCRRPSGSWPIAARPRSPRSARWPRPGRCRRRGPRPPSGTRATTSGRWQPWVEDVALARAISLRKPVWVICSGTEARTRTVKRRPRRCSRRAGPGSHNDPRPTMPHRRRTPTRHRWASGQGRIGLLVVYAGYGAIAGRADHGGLPHL